MGLSSDIYLHHLFLFAFIMLKSSNLNSVSNELNVDYTSSDASAKTNESSRPQVADGSKCSLAASQLSYGILKIAEPKLARTRDQLKELIGKQNKIYIDLSKEKYKLDCSEVSQLSDMMNDVQRYREKLTKIKREMQSIYQRTKVLKKRTANVAVCKQRDYRRKLEKQQQEELLIGNH